MSNTLDTSSRKVPKHYGRYIIITRNVHLVRAFHKVTESVSEAGVMTVTWDTSWSVLWSRTPIYPLRRAPPRGC